MTLSDAIDMRISTRRYLSAPLPPLVCQQLHKAIDLCGRKSGLHVRLITGDSAPFSGPQDDGSLSGVENYLMLEGPADLRDLEEKCGYFGEQLVLTAASMGLQTCWLGGSYDPGACPPSREGDRLVALIAIGHSAEEAPQRRRALKDSSVLASGFDRAPAWASGAVEAVRRAPSAMDRQPYRFTYRADQTVEARLTHRGPFSLVDLGIAKLHFELGAHGGTWSWGNGGIFHKADEEKSCGAVVWRGTPEDHQYLLIQQRAGHWSFPKGHVEGRETEKETAYREIWEETGLETEIDTAFRQVVTYYPKPNVIKDVIFFLASPTGGREKVQEAELADLGWFTFAAARPLVTFATDEDVLLAAEDFINSKK